MNIVIIILFSGVLGYIVIGNYLYLGKVIPKLREKKPEVSASVLPSVQLEQIQEYLKSFHAGTEKPWFYTYLKYIELITVATIVLFFTSIAAIAIKG